MQQLKKRRSRYIRGLERAKAFPWKELYATPAMLRYKEEGETHEMQKCRRFSSESLEMGCPNAKAQFISGQKQLFNLIASNEMYFCISIALKW
ncbi:hypothetical protein BK140_05760 [Paenibacillus macerans]|nr:hypothetical protein BK140_05760 [Paenibacillus macerans]